ncbi:hypothetical protein HY630_03120 [Candidatus Uhrbacteria bacterium]|nr:hypothetical protein [Candidatus Uhrbacteria bacterium]
MATKFPYKRFLLKVRVNPRTIDKLVAAGIRHIQRTAEKQVEVEGRHAAHRGEAHYRRHERTDATGRVMGDSGTPIFGWAKEGTPYDAVALEKIAQDLVDNGGVITDVHIVQKPDDRMGNLVVVFEAEGTPFQFGTEAERLVDELVDSSYGHIHGFKNPDETATINASHKFTSPLDQAKDPRYLRFLPGEDGKVSFRCEKRKIETAPAASASAAS